MTTNTRLWSATDVVARPNLARLRLSLIDSRGTVYLLARLKLKDDKVNTSITLPAYIPDVAKVQMWCAWAEVVLGEASLCGTRSGRTGISPTVGCSST
jgi:hypothetical protein